MKTLAAVVLLVASSFAQTAKTSGPDAALMQKVWDAWNTLDPANAAQYYDQGAQDVFFDIAPLQYHGWKAYQAGSTEMLKQFQSVDCKVGEAKIHPHGSLAWSTAIVHCDAKNKGGSPAPMDFRWTAIWQKKGDAWPIVHEHISAPLPEQPAGGMRPARKPRKS